MPVNHLKIAEPFFGLHHVAGETSLNITERTIVLNISNKPIRVENQFLGHLQSVLLSNTILHDIERAILVDRFDAHLNDEVLCAEVRKAWPTAYKIRGEERLQGVEHYMSPKVFIGNLGLTFYHSASVPLNVGLHKEHPFCPVPGFREVHTQIVGFGKMQQCRECDPATVYLEELMAPGSTHRPMYDLNGNYPWHQYETITQGIFLAVEMLPDGVTIPEL